MNNCKKQNTLKLNMESLEQRRLMAGEITIDDAGVVTIEGTDQADTVVVSQPNGRIRVALNDVSETFAINQVSKIVFHGDDGDDRFRSHAQAVCELFGGAGNDVLVGGANDDRLFGEEGDDVLAGRDGNDMLSGGQGKDRLHGGGKADDLDGGLDNDRLYGENGADVIDGGAGNDLLVGGFGEDDMQGGAGNDRMHGGRDDDRLRGGAGHDRLFGEFDDDELFGDDGNDRLWGGEGADTIDAGAHHDRITGDAQDRRFIGGAGRDSLRYLGPFVSDPPSMDGVERLLVGEAVATRIRLSNGGQFIFDTPTSGRRIDPDGQTAAFHSVEFLRDPNSYFTGPHGLIGGTAIGFHPPENKEPIGSYRIEIVPNKSNDGHYQFRQVHIYGIAG